MDNQTWRAMRRSTFAAIVSALSCVVLLSASAGAAYPEKVIRIIVPVAPGGLADATARAAAARFQKAFGQQVVIENRAGGNFQIGTAAAIASPPDGYTLLLGLDGPIAINPSLYPKLPYNPFKDLVPISGIARADQVVIAHPSVPAKDFAELLALAKTKPGEITFGAFGIGSTSHLYMEMLQSMAGVKFQAVQYKGATPMITDVVAGHVNVTSVSLGQSMPLHNDGKIKILGVATKERIPALPNIPTVAESVPGFEAKAWFGLFAPAGTPPDIVEKLSAELQALAKDPDFRDKVLGRYRMTPIASSPAEFKAFVENEAAMWKKIIEERKLQID
ncbi:MAG: Bug family tripartite tricarboxylate transporter substrate binding protein [Xanthobacteraceae bacterium]